MKPQDLSLVIPRLSRRFSCIMLLRPVLLHTVRMIWRSCLSFPIGNFLMNIYVGNLAFSTTDHDLRQLFEPYGVVDECRVIIDRETGRSKGFGFVEMPDGTAARTAMATLQGREMEGRTLTVNEAKPREPRRDSRQARW